jgi:hypothetical protein
VVREAQKLAKGPALYLTKTHFHPEHTAGESAFLTSAILIRPSAQQDEVDRRGAEYIDLFSNRSEQNKELLQGVKLRRRAELCLHDPLSHCLPTGRSGCTPGQRPGK